MRRGVTCRPLRDEPVLHLTTANKFSETLSRAGVVLRADACVVPLTPRQILGSRTRRLAWSVGIVRLLFPQANEEYR